MVHHAGEIPRLAFAAGVSGLAFFREIPVQGYVKASRVNHVPPNFPAKVRQAGLGGAGAPSPPL